MSSLDYAASPVGGNYRADPRSRSDNHDDVTPGEIAVGVIIGRSSEYFDFFVFGIASVLVFPSVFFPHFSKLNGTLLSFAIFSIASFLCETRTGCMFSMFFYLLGLAVCRTSGCYGSASRFSF